MSAFGGKAETPYKKPNANGSASGGSAFGVVFFNG
jgi:hypothetical protein